MWHRLNNSIAMLLFKLSSALSGISFAGFHRRMPGVTGKCRAEGYFRLVHWSYMNFLHASLIYNVEIRRLVPEKTSGTHFPDAAAHSPGQENPPLSAMDIPFYIRPVCSGASFFLSGNS